MTTETGKNVQVRAAWDTNAAFWDAQMGEGNTFHLQLIEPSVLQLLELRRNESILEIACGNGQFARKLTALGARVTAIDFSPNMIERARAHTEPYNDRIEYRVLDATNESELRSLGVHQFDAVVSNMALMDMADIEPLFRAIPQLLKPEGRFVFSTMHPCFNSNNPTFAAELSDDAGTIVETFSIKLDSYLEPKSYEGLAMNGQPVPHPYFHRPLHELLGAGFRAGMVLDGLLEPRLRVEQSSPRWWSWLNYDEFPPVLTVRLRAI